ncbi:MAG: AMP-binding protein, partial [Rhodospirillales bacterium]|nr:AMP-binding protein [Rhodospirillales bacterium]
NVTAGTQGMLAAQAAAGLGTIVTSRRFVEAATLGEAVRELGASSRIVWLEDLRIGRLERLGGLARALLARAIHRRAAQARADDAAVVLFTSGSEGTPKGVVLSHRNILANQAQLASVVDFNPADTVFNALPMFHAFGLTGGFLLPVLSGVKTFLYPSPLHFRSVCELVYATNATILFGTNTFLAGYARVAHPYDFYAVRYVFAGAEAVREETRRLWMDKFGLRLLEGYGATETAPVIATNTAMMYRAGTVGLLLPGIEARIEPVEGLARGGRLFVKGPNVMLGYLRAQAPGILEPPPAGWFDTGDIVAIDGEGFVTILGRARRFAKIAGEMVSLGAVEAFVARAWPEWRHAVLAQPDARRGETLVLVTERPGAERGSLLEAAQREGMAELLVPRKIVTISKLPLLGSGKTDYAALLAAAGADGRAG